MRWDTLEDARAARRRFAWRVAETALDMAKELEWVPDAHVEPNLQKLSQFLADFILTNNEYHALKGEAGDEG